MDNSNINNNNYINNSNINSNNNISNNMNNKCDTHGENCDRGCIDPNVDNGMMTKVWGPPDGYFYIVFLLDIPMLLILLIQIIKIRNYIMVNF